MRNLTTAAAPKVPALSMMTSPTELASVLNLTISTCKDQAMCLCAYTPLMYPPHSEVPYVEESCYSAWTLICEGPTLH